MGFLTPALLAGSLFVIVPVLLHLIMRRQPQQLDFPALRFVKKRQEANRRRLNLRHWLLLALRCLLIAGIACALARPTLRGSGLQGKEGAPLAVALVVDNSLRMQYVKDNQTRLQRAQEMAKWLVGKLPEESEIAVMELGRSASGFVVDQGTAESRILNLSPETSPRPLVDAVENAIELVAAEVDRRQEVFVFSDLSTAAFEESALERLTDVMAAAPDVRVYLVDVGVENANNLTLAPLELRSTVLRTGEELTLDVTITSTGINEQPLVEVFIEEDSGEPVKRAQRIVELDAEGKGSATFSLGDLPEGSHQGFVQVTPSDPLDFDNLRYFTVEVRPAARVLLLAENRQDALFLREALSPQLFSGQEPLGFECSVERFSEAASPELEDYDAVCLLDPPPLSEDFWNQLTDYATSGGGVGIFLGHRARPSGFNSETPQRLLPGELKLRSRRETYFRPRRLDHPSLKGLKNYAEEIPWQIYPVWTYWEFENLAGDTYVVARFANDQPALFERSVGRGRVITLATSVSDPMQPEGREPWNLLPTHPEPWPFVALSNELVGYLARDEQGQLNFVSGETVSIRLSPRQFVTDYVLKQPAGDAVRRTLPPGENAIRISTTNQLGNYRVASGGRSGTLNRGFSVNAPPEMSELTRVEPNILLSAFPEDRVHLARTVDDVNRYVDIGRSGRELYSWAIVMVVLLWSSEHMLANRFYREEQHD